MAEQRLLEFRYSPFNGKEIPYDVYRDGERLFSLSEALKRGIVREVFREEKTAEFLPGHVKTGYRIVPSSYGKPNPEGASEVFHWKLLPPMELDRILEEKEELKEALRDTAERGRKAEMELRKLKKELYHCVRPKVEELRTELEDFSIIHPSELGCDREAIKERLERELQELEERERELKERIKMMKKEYGKELAVAQLYRNVLFDEDIFVFPSYLLELEGREAGDEEVLERMKDLLDWIPETPQGLTFGLALVGKVYGILPEGLDIENLRDRTFETQEEAGDAVVREVERFRKKIEPLLQSGTEPEL